MERARSGAPVVPPSIPRAGALHAVVVTFNRSDDLRRMLNAVVSQTRPPASLLCVDNGSDPTVRTIVESFGFDYLATGENGGPAGGIAAGVETVLETANLDDWIVLLDDDDPPQEDGIFERLLGLAERLRDNGHRVGGIGVTGARYDRRGGRIERLRDAELEGILHVDYIGGNQLPLYSVECIREAGLFDRSFFFGFEELEYGLRVVSHDWALMVDGATALDYRQAAGRMGIESPRAAVPASPWRRYYSARNAVRIAARWGRRGARWRCASRTFAGCVRRCWQDRSLSTAVLECRGVLDGLRDVGGCTVEPTAVK